MASTRVGSRQASPPGRRAPARRPPARRAPARRAPRRRGAPRRSVGPFALIAILIAVGGLVWDRRDEVLLQTLAGHCSLPGQELSLTTEQAANAATIAAVARARGLPPRATVIALATAQQESRLRNLDHGDRDSLGLFQQRPSQGWGSAAQVRDPVYAAGEFFDHLVEVPRWETGRLTDVSQAVQRSGYPEAYQQWEGLADTVAAALLSTTPAALSCSFPPADEVGALADRTAALTTTVRREAGDPTVEPDGAVTVADAGWPEATWAVAHAERFQLTSVTLDGWRWTAATGWEQTPSAFALPLQLRLT